VHDQGYVSRVVAQEKVLQKCPQSFRGLLERLSAIWLPQLIFFSESVPDPTLREVLGDCRETTASVACLDAVWPTEKLFDDWLERSCPRGLPEDALRSLQASCQGACVERFRIRDIMIGLGSIPKPMCFFSLLDSFRSQERIGPNKLTVAVQT
jgi:hypothetical protein